MLTPEQIEQIADEVYEKVHAQCREYLAKELPTLAADAKSDYEGLMRVVMACFNESLSASTRITAGILQRVIADVHRA